MKDFPWFCKQLWRDRLAGVGLLIVLALLLSAAFAPYLAPYPDDVYDIHPAARLQPPRRIGNPKAFFAPPPWLHASVGGHPCPRRLPRPQRAAAARRSGPRKVERGVARLWRVLGMRLRMGEGRASGVSWGEDLGKGVGGIDFKRDFKRSEV